VVEMETWIILSIIVGIAAMLILISVALNLFGTSYVQEEIEGDKQYVLSSIANLIYDCFEKNEGRSGSVICNQFTMESTEEISSSDRQDLIDLSGISSIEVENLGQSAEIIIRYENQVIYVEKVENERISS